MGLQNQLNDVSSDSILLLLISLIATSFSTLRSFLLSLLHHLGLFAHPLQNGLADDPVLISAGSGLSGLILLSEQLNINKAVSHSYCSTSSKTTAHRGRGSEGLDCVVCCCRINDGDQVRELPCRHLFHGDCIQGWLHQLKFSCPLCRFQLVPGERVDATRTRVGGDLLSWFSALR